MFCVKWNLCGCVWVHKIENKVGPKDFAIQPHLSTAASSIRFLGCDRSYSMSTALISIASAAFFLLKSAPRWRQQRFRSIASIVQGIGRFLSRYRHVYILFFLPFCCSRFLLNFRLEKLCWVFDLCLVLNQFQLLSCAMNSTIETHEWLIYFWN